MRFTVSFTVSLVVSVSVLAFAGCSNPNAPAPPVTVDLHGQVPPAQSPQMSGAMPPSISEAYQNGEQAYDAVSSAGWDSAAKQITALKSSLSQVRADLKPVTDANDATAKVVASKESQIDSDLIPLDDAIRDHHQDSARRDSNGITKSIAELAGMYSSPVMGEMMMLKYYSRQYEIASAADDAPLLKETAADISQVWSGLQPAVEDHGGTTEARQFNDLVGELQNSSRPGQLGSVLRDRVSEIQEVLKR